MKRLLIVVALTLLPATGMAGEPRSHIDEALIKFFAAFNAGDAAGIASLYTDDAALFPPGGDRVDGRSAIQTFWQGAIDSGMKLTDLRAIEVDASGDVAGEVGAFTATVPGESGTTTVAGQYIVIWKRTGHTWQLHRDIWNTK